MDEKLFFHLLDLTNLNTLFYCHFVGPRFLTKHYTKPYKAGRPRSMATKEDDIALRSNEQWQEGMSCSNVMCILLCFGYQQDYMK
jgi:hypothetical protein